MAWADTAVTVSTADKFIPDVWSMEVLRATEDALVMAPLVKRYDSLVAERGDTIHIPNLSNLHTHDKTATAEVELQSITETEKTIEINTHKEASFLVEDIVKVQSNYDLMAEYTNKAGYAIADAVDTSVLGLYTGFTNTDVGTYGTDVTNPVILAAIEAIDIANAPLEDRAFVFHPKQKTAIAKIDQFVRADYLGNYQSAKPAAVGAQSRYLWGELWGIPAYYTNKVPTTAGTPTQYHNILFHKEAMALALQQKPRVQSEYMLNYLGTLVVCDVIYGVKVLRTDFGIEIRS